MTPCGIILSIVHCPLGSIPKKWCSCVQLTECSHILARSRRQRQRPGRHSYASSERREDWTAGGHAAGGGGNDCRTVAYPTTGLVAATHRAARALRRPGSARPPH